MKYMNKNFDEIDTAILRLTKQEKVKLLRA